MVLTHTTTHTYAHPFPTVTLAYFLRYCSPQLNPFSAHVLSTDTIEQRVDPATGRLHTTRIHLKRSKLPPAVMKLLPASLTGGAADKASYILETSVVDMREGWMTSDSRNLNFAGVLSVVEKQKYTAPQPLQQQRAAASSGPGSRGAAHNAAAQQREATTDVSTTLILHSRFRLAHNHAPAAAVHQAPQAQASRQEEGHDAQQPEGGSWLSRLGVRSVQRTIESLASTRTQDQLGKSREGMSLILERLRQSGIINVLELARRTREQSLGDPARA